MSETLSSTRFQTRQDFVRFCRSENMAFLAENRKRVYVEYVREPSINDLLGPDLDSPYPNIPSRGKPTAVLVALRADDGTLSMGWSAAKSALYDASGVLLRPAEEFSKPIGLWKAIRRATGQGRTTGQIPKRLVEGGYHLMHGHSGNGVIDFMRRAMVELDAR